MKFKNEGKSALSPLSLVENPSPLWMLIDGFLKFSLLPFCGSRCVHDIPDVVSPGHRVRWSQHPSFLYHWCHSYLCPGKHFWMPLPSSLVWGSLPKWPKVWVRASLLPHLLEHCGHLILHRFSISIIPTHFPRWQSCRAGMGCSPVITKDRVGQYACM
jgi:hypothetical protein